MRSKTKLVAVKLTPTEAQAVEQLVELGYFSTASALLRAALIGLLQRFNVKPDVMDQIRVERIVHPQRKRKQSDDVATEE